MANLRGQAFLLIVALEIMAGCPVISFAQARLLSPSQMEMAAPREKGLPYLRNYPPKEYGAFMQNWAVVQDPQGVLYFGNGHGVLTYNGVAWQLLETPDKSIIRSLALDPSGRLYAGAADDLGYLASDGSGKLRFQSLLSYLKPEDRHFADVWKVHTTPDGVYFQADQYLFRWANNRFTQWKADSAFHWSFWVNHHLYVQDKKWGLLEMRNDLLQPIAQSEKIAGMKVQVMLPLDSKRVLIGTRQNGLFLYDGSSIVPFSAQVNAFLKANQLYNGQVLTDGTYALATLRGGAVQIDRQGRLLQVINKAKGLPTDAVYNLGIDHQGGWWLALEKGISRVELTAPLSVYGASDGLEGSVNALVRHTGNLYAATSRGLFRLRPSSESGESARFEAVMGLSESCWSFFADGEALLVATERGVCQLKNNRLTWLNAHRCNTFYRSRISPDRLFVSLEDGLASLRWNGQEWKDEGKVGGIHEEIHSITETADGKLWLSTFWQGIIRLTFPSAAADNPAERLLPVVERMGQAQGLPKGYVKASVVEGQLLVRMNDLNKLYRFDEASHRFRFVSNQQFAQRFGLTGQEAYPSEDQLPSGEIWLRTKGEADQSWQRTRAVPLPNGSYQRQTYRVDRITEDIGRSFYPDSNGVVWYGGPDGIVRHDLSLEKGSKPAFQTLLDRILVNRDSVVYPSRRNHSFAYRYNSLRFEFGAPSYDQASANQFQYQLEGYDEGWSAWGPEAFKEYTRIPPGAYLFKVRARNIYGQVGYQATYEVIILPPWYQAWPMYGLYALLLAGSLYATVQWRSRQLRARSLALEKLVQDRTHEISDQNQQLEAQAVQLEKQTQQLRELDQVKARFFANISHEFRTPLTLILGTLSNKIGWFRQQSQVSEAPIQKVEVQVMHRNAQRLLQLVNQLLDLSKVESGQLKLHYENGDLIELLNVVMASFSSLAEFHRIHFKSIVPAPPVLCRFDADLVEKILYNLLSNAFKFTPDDGEINLKAELIPEAGDQASYWQVTLQDSGPGIAADQLEKVFDRFYQGDQPFHSDQQGTGIGLALTKELVQLHGGTVWAESPQGQGARFIVRLPFLTPDLSATDGTFRPQLQERAFLLADRDDSLENVLAQGQIAEGSLPEDEALPVLLIVEDNGDLRHYIRTQLARQYRVLESENGRSGWEMALSALPDLIISDWMMPEMDGIKLCQLIKSDERTSHIPYILLTALATSEGKMTGLETGADEYLTKPFDAHELQLRIRNLIEIRHLLRERFSRQIRVQPADITVNSADEKFLQRVLRIVEENMGDSEFSVEQFGQEVGLSRMQLHRKLTTLTGQSARDFIRVMRLKRAAQLLEAHWATVSEIAYEVGFNNLSYFAKCFKEQFGVLPNEYLSRPVNKPE